MKIKKWFFTGTKEITYSNIHQETETTMGGKWFASGDHYLIKSKITKRYFLGIFIGIVSEESSKELYAKEHEI